MKPIQLVVLGVALVAAIGLAMVARNMMSAPSDVPVVQAGEKVIIKKAPTVVNYGIEWTPLFPKKMPNLATMMYE